MALAYLLSSEEMSWIGLFLRQTSHSPAYASLELSILGGSGGALALLCGVSLPGAEVLGSVSGQAYVSDIHSCSLNTASPICAAHFPWPHTHDG